MHTDSKRKSTTALLLRHGQTDYPKDRYYNDVLENPPLNQHGIRQAGVWPGRFKEWSRPIAAVYTSPSRRTQETARIAAAGLNLPLETVEDLRERDFGFWGGLSAGEIKTRFPEAWAEWRADTLHFIPDGGESLVGFSKRIAETMEALVLRHQNQLFLAVTHVGPIRMIVAAALGMPLHNLKRLIIRNGSMTEVEYTKRWPNLHALSFAPDSANKET